jgi:hypothetical protein
MGDLFGMKTFVIKFGKVVICRSLCNVMLIKYRGLYGVSAITRSEIFYKIRI